MNASFSIPGVIVIDHPRVEDSRGFFIKNFQSEILKMKGIDFKTAEVFYSLSQKNVIRGMHFQVAPVAQAKLVHCMRGKILDVLLDLRKGSHFGKVESISIESLNPQTIFIPKGVAHGFLSLEDETMVSYQVTAAYDEKRDKGIRWDSFGFNWGISNPIVSERDQVHSPWKTYQDLEFDFKD